jgi:hypothetical protein
VEQGSSVRAQRLKDEALWAFHVLARKSVMNVVNLTGADQHLAYPFNRAPIPLRGVAQTQTHEVNKRIPRIPGDLDIGLMGNLGMVSLGDIGSFDNLVLVFLLSSM